MNNKQIVSLIVILIISCFFAILGSSGSLFLISGIGYEIEKIQESIFYNASLNIRTFEGLTNLMIASKKGDATKVRDLIEAGADVNAKDSLNWTALMYASDVGQSEIVNNLIEAGADVNAKAKDGQTALINSSLYSQEKDIEIVKELIEAGADVNAEDNYNRTALEKAINYGSYEILKNLDSGITPTKEDYVEIAKILKEAEAKEK